MKELTGYISSTSTQMLLSLMTSIPAFLHHLPTAAAATALCAEALASPSLNRPSSTRVAMSGAPGRERRTSDTCTGTHERRPSRSLGPKTRTSHEVCSTAFVLQVYAVKHPTVQQAPGQDRKLLLLQGAMPHERTCSSCTRGGSMPLARTSRAEGRSAGFLAVSHLHVHGMIE